MAKTYKISAYVVDTDDQLTRNLVDFAFLDKAFGDQIIHQYHVEESDKYEWNDNVPENAVNCDLAELEGRFNHSSDTKKDRAKVMVGGLYKHFKGHLVKVLAVSKGTEYGDWVVVYEHMGDHRIWHRPIEMFVSEVDHEKYPDVQQKHRFELVTED